MVRTISLGPFIPSYSAAFENDFECRNTCTKKGREENSAPAVWLASRSPLSPPGGSADDRPLKPANGQPPSDLPIPGMTCLADKTNHPVERAESQ